ncbi:hypothetical protein [Glutamicibacter soli]|uniref:hypothetical protein n=1 Tax=Glutamicibacter soli TaxID=453836 RepID=UPI0011BD51DA|nr:hypothetical protein [Glutamicibacter soli]
MPAKAAPAVVASGETAVTAASQPETNNLAEKMRSLKNGESFTYSSPTGDNFKIININGQLNFYASGNPSIASP